MVVPRGRGQSQTGMPAARKDPVVSCYSHSAQHGAWHTVGTQYKFAVFEDGEGCSVELGKGGGHRQKGVPLCHCVGGRSDRVPGVSREQGLLGILLPLNLTTEEERGDRERLAPETQCVKRTESELLETATWQAPSWISVPPILTSSSHLHFVPFRAVPSTKGQQMVPVSCWPQLEQTSQTASPQPTSWPSRAWGMLKVWLTKFLIKEWGRW